MSDDLLEYYGRRAPEYEGITGVPSGWPTLRLSSRTSSNWPRASRDRDRLRDGLLDESDGPERRFHPGHRRVTRGAGGCAGSWSAAGKVTLGLADAFRLRSVARFPGSHVPQPLSDFGSFDVLFAGFWWSHVRREELASFLQVATPIRPPRCSPGVRRQQLRVGKQHPLVADRCRRQFVSAPTTRGRRGIRGAEELPGRRGARSRDRTICTDVRITRSRFFWLLSGTTPGSSP